MGYERMFPKTSAGEVEIKQLPTMRCLTAELADEDYFAGGNGLFMRLFRYIKRNEVPMTVPVEVRVERPATMRFFVGEASVDRELADADEVRVERLPARTVAARALRGSYTRERYDRALSELREWLAANPRYAAAGEPFVTYWNSPFTPGFLKHAEVCIPVVEGEQPGAD